MVGKKDDDGRKEKLLKICYCYFLKYFCVDNSSMKSIILVKQVNKYRDILQKKKGKERKDIENV